MKTLDRYIIRQFLINFVILTFALMSLFILVDLLADFDEFLSAGRARAADFGGTFLATLYSVADYYYPMTLLFFVFFSGLLVVAAMGFTLWQLKRAGELTAMLAGGISMHRVSAPVLVVGCLLNLAALPVQEYLVPRLAGKLARGKSEVREDFIRTFDVKFARDAQNSLFSASAFSPRDNKLSNLLILERNSDSGFTRRITAESAVWNESQGRWDLSKGMAVNYGPTSLAGEAAPDTDRTAIAFYPTNLSPEVLLARRATIYPRLLSLAELRRMAGNPAADGALINQIMHSRFSLLVVNVLILLMALPFFLLREPANLMAQAVKAGALTLAAWGTAIVIMQVSAGPMNPYTAAWLPVIVYLPVSAVVIQMVKT